MTKEKKQFIVEVRALIEDCAPFREKLEELGAKLVSKESLVDRYFTRKGSKTESLWDQAGEAIRIREISSEKCLVTRKEAVVKDGEKYRHGVSDYQVLLKGSCEEAEDFVEKEGLKPLIMLKKTRETFELGDIAFCLDEIEDFGPALEAIARVSDRKQIDKAKSKLEKFLEKIGVKKFEIEETSITYRLLLAKISKNPKERLFALQEELKQLEKKLAKNLLTRGEAYHTGGDGWHDNAWFETLEAEFDFLHSRIHEIRQEIAKIRKGS